MKHVHTHNRAFRFAALLGLATVFGGITALTPAQAQNGRDYHNGSQDWRDRRDRQELRYDANTLRREREHLRDLQHRRDDARRHRDWDAVHRLDAAIRTTQWRIDNKRFDVRHDYDSYYSDSDRAWFRSHNH